jgi:HD-like signal output (HDOD) protein
MTIETSKDSTLNLPWAYFRLRPFPQIAIRVMQLANRDEVPLHKLSGLISSDPAFSSEVLTIANSALYAPRVPATSILQAVARLGTRCIQGLCITVGVRTYLGKTLSEPAMQAIWRHNLACALIAEQIALVSCMDKDMAYTAGVVHDIGRLALAAIRPKEYLGLLEGHVGTSASILNAERELFGCDHCEAGKLLIADWMLPHEFEEIVSKHHIPGHKGGTWTMSDVVDLSCRLADTAGFTAFTGCEAALYPELIEELPAPQRSVFHPNIESLSQDILSKIRAVEAV